MRCHLLSHRLWSGWQPLRSLFRGRTAAASMIAASIGGALMLMPTGPAWPNLSFADAFASATALDWVRGSLGLMFSLRRRLSSARQGLR